MGAVNPIVRVLNSEPIDRVARRVTFQGGCSDIDGDLTRDELVYLWSRLERKLRLLKQVLRITSKAQHKNLIYAINSGRRHRPGVGMLRLTANPRTALEYKRVGEEMQRLSRRLAELKQVDCAERKRIGALENAWKEAHPGWIWTGVLLVAPDGSTFRRAEAA
jgi:hypothetical protein